MDALSDLGLSREDYLIHRIGQTPVLVAEIFRHLPMKDLYICARVCKLWNSVSQRTKTSRHQVSWMFWKKQSQGSPDEEIGKHICSVLREVRSRPKVAIAFAACSVSNAPILNHMIAELPSDCLLLGAICEGVVGTSASFESFCLDDDEDGPSFTTLFLPEIPGIDIYPFVVHNCQDTWLRESLSGKEILSLTGIPVDKKVKCMIGFGDRNVGGGNACRLIAQFFLEKQSFKFAYGGGFGNMLAPKHRSSVGAVGVAFCGEKVEAASVMLGRGVQSKDDVHSVLIELKRCGLPEDRSFAFMFCGVPCDVQVKVFRQIFPKTPLFGIFGYGAFGCKDLLSSKDLPVENYDVDGDDDMFSFLGTAVVLISILR